MKFESGSRINIWKQDPTVQSLGVRTTFIHSKVNSGPGDSQITIKGLPYLSPDSNGDFLITPPAQYVVEDVHKPPVISVEEQRFDAAHTYATVRKVLTMYQRILGRELKWVWNTESNKEPLAVYPHAKLGRAAYYDRGLRSLRFQYFYIKGKRPMFHCRSIDIVSHETAHAIFDSLKPNWSVSEPGRRISLGVAALQEALCDLTSIFFILSQLDLVEYIIVQTKADLHHKDNILATWCEQLEEIPGYMGARSAINDLKLSEAGTNVHRISEVFTAAVYDTLANIFNVNREPDSRNDAETLYQVSQYMLSLLVKSIVRSPESNASFTDVANEMIKITEGDGQLRYAEFIRNNFVNREILKNNGTASSFKNLSSHIVPDFKGCCGTLSGEEIEK